MKKINKYLSGILAACMLFTSVPLNALPFVAEPEISITEETTENLPEITNDETTGSETTDTSEEQVDTSTDTSTGSTESTESTESSETTESSESTEEEGPVIINPDEDSEETTESTESNSSESTENDSEANSSTEDTATSGSENNNEANKPAFIAENDGEEEIDPLAGWDLSLLLYDQDEANGKVGKTEITWTPEFELDSNNSNYGNAVSKTIKMQINYKNTAAVKEYAPGELSFVVPNLAYNITSSKTDTNLSVVIINAANDDSHSGYDWTFTGYDASLKSSYTSPSPSIKYMVFTNAKTIEAGSNFEGSVQIVYNFTSESESPEVFIDECVHSFYNKFNSYFMLTEDFNQLKENFANLKKDAEEIITTNVKNEMNYDVKMEEFETQKKQVVDKYGFDMLSSPEYPSNYPNNVSESSFTKYYSFEDANSITITFDENSNTEKNYDYIYIYDMNTNKKIDTLQGNLSNVTKTYDTNNLKITFKSDGSNTYKFRAVISPGTVATDDEINNFYQEITPIEEAESLFAKKYENTLNEKLEELTFKTIIENNSFKNISTNSITLDYTRTYKHPWKKRTYTMTETALPIEGTDILPKNWEDYTWVKYSFNDTLYTSSGSTYSYPYLYVSYKYATIKETFADDCLVISPRGNTLTPDENGVYTLTWDETYINSISSYSQYNNREVYVGYPKSIYNEENGNLLVTNESELWGPYGNSTREYEYLNKSSVSINLADFGFKYPEGIISIGKTNSSSSYMYYQNIIEDKTNKALTDFRIYPNLINTNKETYTLKVGDDILYATDLSGNYTKLTDNEYYYKYIYFPVLYNQNWQAIPSNKYDCELWVRYANETDYTLYAEFKNPSSTKNFSFKDTDEKKIVAYYFLIKDLQEGIISTSDKGYFYNQIRFMKSEIPQEGKLYNFAYTQLYKKDTEGNLIWVNQAELGNYDTLMTQMKIAEYDLETYGDYVQRDTAYDTWTYYTVKKPEVSIKVQKYNTPTQEIIQDDTNQEFTGEYKIGAVLNPYINLEEEYFESYDKNYMISGYSMYDLLPKGVTCESTEKEIKESLVNNFFYTKYPSSHSRYSIYYVNKDGEKLTDNEFLEMLKENIEVTITENWKGTGRTHIKVYFPFDEPLFIFNQSYGSSSSYRYYPAVTIKWSISYDSFIEYGNQYKSYLYSDWESETYTYTSGSIDNGANDKEASDINDNGLTTDYIQYSSSTISLISAVSTHQDVQKSVATDLSDYNPKSAEASTDSPYNYKLRVRTGQNDITDLIIKDNLETAFGERDYWQGTFLGIDTSYVEDKTFYYYDPSDPAANESGMVAEKIDVVPYYSTNPNETDLFETEVKSIENEDGEIVEQTVFKLDADGNKIRNTNWQPYDENVDKSTVKSLAFEFLKAGTNEDAIIPSNSMVYVLINFQTPADDSIKTLAYNSCSTQWTAIDFTGEEMPYITGVTSNKTKVLLPNSVDADAMPSIELDITKEIIGTSEAFENMGLDPNGTYSFMLNFKALTPNENDEYVDINAVIDNKNTTIVKLPVGSYLITEADDSYFDFVDIISTMDPEIIVDGVTFEKTEQGYVITVTDDVMDDSFYTLKVTNEIEPDRTYEEKDNAENLFKASTTPAADEPKGIIEFFANLFGF